MPAHLHSLLAALFVLVAACSGPETPAASWEELGHGGASPATSNPDAALAFEDALALYHAGRYDDALEAFRLFSATHPGDPLAVSAELHGARVLASLGRFSEARFAFAALESAPEDAGVRYAATLYLAFVESLDGNTQGAFAALAAALAATPDLRVPEPWIVDGDSALLGSLLAEARIRRGDAFGALFDLALVARDGDDQLVDYAANRAVSLAEESLSRHDLERGRESSDPFVLAAVAPPLAATLREDGRIDEARALLLDAELHAARWGVPARIAEELELLASASDDRIARYGAALSLTGPNRRAGRAALGAMLLAQRAFEDRPSRSTLVIRDTQSTSEGARLAVEALAAEGVSIILGPIEADLVDAATSDVPLVALSPMPLTPASPPNVFRWMLDAGAEAEAVVDEAHSRGAARWVIVEEPPDTASSWFIAFAHAAGEAIESRGGVVVERIAFPPGQGDPTATQEAARLVAGNVAATDADAVLFALPADLTATLGAYLVSEGIWPSRDGQTRNRAGRRQATFATSSFALGDVLLRNSSAYFEGAIIPCWFEPTSATGPAREFADRFDYTYGRPAGVIEAFAFDAATAARRLVSDEGLHRSADVSRRMQEGVAIDGVVGPLRFDRDGNPDVAPRLCTVSGGRFAAP
jgi:ABC-type branched-subunit amino acid transport system substrate-binding protein